MTGAIEQRIGEALQSLMTASGRSAPALERRLGLPPGDLATLLAGREALDLPRLQRVLAVLGTSPSLFFAGLYDDDGGGRAVPAGVDGVAAAPAAALDRQEIERLVNDLRAMIRSMVQLLETREGEVGAEAPPLGVYDFRP